MLRVSLQKEREGEKVKQVALLNHFHFLIKPRTKTCWYFLTTFPFLCFLLFPLFSRSLFPFPVSLPPTPSSLPLSVINSYTDEAQLSVAASTVRKCSHCLHKAAPYNGTNHGRPLNFNQANCTAFILQAVHRRFLTAIQNMCKT